MTTAIRNLRLAAGLALGLLVLGCSGSTGTAAPDGGRPDAGVDADGGNPGESFSLGLAFDRLNLARGGSVGVPVTLTMSPGFASPVDVRLSGASSLTADALHFPAQGGSQVMVVHAAPGAPLGPQTVSISAEGGAIAQEAPLELDLSAADFALSVSPASVAVNPGDAGTAQVGVAGLFDFGPVALSCSGATLGVSCALSGTNVPGPDGGSFLTPVQVTAAPGTPEETVRVTINARSLADGGLSHALPLDVNVRERTRWLVHLPVQGNATAVEVTPWNTLMIAYGAPATLAEFDRSGNLLGQRTIPTPAASTVSAFAWGPEGALYAAGRSGTSAFLDRFAEDGGVQWEAVLNGGGGSTTRGTDLTIDDAGSAYLVGWTQGAIASSPRGGVDAFAVSYAPDGGRRWGLQYGTTADDFVESAQFADGGLMLLGHHEGIPNEPRLLDVLDLDGGYVGGDSFVAAGFDGGSLTTSTRMRLDGEGTVWIAGYSGAPFGQPASGGSDGVLARYFNGNLVQVVPVVTSGRDEIYGLALDAQDNVFVSGRTDGGADPIGRNTPFLARVAGP